MNNTTTTTTIEMGAAQWLNLPWYVLYVLQGLITVGGNGLIVLSIARFEALRCSKEFVFMLALSLADGINMAGYFFAGLHRGYLLFAGTHHLFGSVRACLLTVHNMLWSVGLHTSAMMLVVVSCDRLLCVMFPLTYLGLTATYARRFVSSVYIYNICIAVYIYVKAWDNPTPIPLRCVPSNVVGVSTSPVFISYYTRTQSLMATASVFLYVLVGALYRRASGVGLAGQPNQQFELKCQRRITVSLAISALCTFCLYVVPYSFAVSFFNAGYYNVAVALWCTSNLNPLANVVIYPLRHREVKQAIRALVHCKEMPVDLKNWNNTNTTPAAQGTNQQPKPVVVQPQPRPATVQHG